MSSDKYRKQDVARAHHAHRKSWLTEAPLRMLMNNLDPEVAENPHELVVYGGIAAPRATGRAMTRLSSL